MQGDRLIDPEHLAQLCDVMDSETFVVVPCELLTRFAPRDAERADNTLSKFGRPRTAVQDGQVIA
ncbi:hypothetical protein GCM10022206_43950 [Streptomyces chiangmaiensis]